MTATHSPNAPEAPETEIVTTWKVACDGGEGALGHPCVWLSIPRDTGFVECGYCDKKYVIDRDHAHDDH
ncbi:MAG: zinc-finger domain-containing protein [Thioclava sp.]|nr:zinc-finger domain-containing protein [Thioclava sp.]MBD3802974.1 zinc-finger domain-containing protein [Thioclava sp.]